MTITQQQAIDALNYLHEVHGFREDYEPLAILRQYIEQGAQPGAAKSLNAMAADLLRPYLKLGQKVIWRESFRWHDDNGVLSNHYDGMELEQLSDAFGYDWRYDMNLKHAAIVWDKVAAPQPQQEQPK
jgi:hypothetical protein